MEEGFMNRLALKTSARRIAVADDYLNLVREFPLRPLRARSEHRAALTILGRMLGREDLTKGQTDYLAALVHFVKDYERERGFFQLKKLPPIEILKDLMEQNELSTSDLGDII